MGGMNFRKRSQKNQMSSAVRSLQEMIIICLLQDIAESKKKVSCRLQTLVFLAPRPPKVSLLGVYSLWGDCTFILAEWGSYSGFVLFCNFEDFSL